MVNEWEHFEDITSSEHLLPTFGLRIMVGLDHNGKMRVLLDRAGSIDSTQLIGILEVVQSKLFRDFTA